MKKYDILFIALLIIFGLFVGIAVGIIFKKKSTTTVETKTVIRYKNDSVNLLNKKNDSLSLVLKEYDKKVASKNKTIKSLKEEYASLLTDYEGNVEMTVEDSLIQLCDTIQKEYEGQINSQTDMLIIKDSIIENSKSLIAIKDSTILKYDTLLWKKEKEIEECLDKNEKNNKKTAIFSGISFGIGAIIGIGISFGIGTIIGIFAMK